MNKVLKKSLEKKWCIRLDTRHPDKEAYDGVVIHRGASIIAIREFRDFAGDGIVVFPTRLIAGVQDGKFEACENTILKRSKEIAKAKRLPWLDPIDTIGELVAVLSRRKIWPSLEQVKGKNSALYVGPILHAEEKCCESYCYDAAGNWEKIYTIKYDEIFKVEFDSTYLRYFNDYMLSVEKPLQPVGF